MLGEDNGLHLNDLKAGLPEPLTGTRHRRRLLLVLGGNEPALQDNREKVFVTEWHLNRPSDQAQRRQCAHRYQ